MELKDFTSEPKITVEDLAPLPKENPIANRPSNINVAAHAAGLQSPEDIADTYRAVQLETEVDSSSFTADDIFQATGDAQFRQSQEALVEMLSDPNMSLENKTLAIEGFQSMQPQLYDPRNQVANKYLQEPGERENEETAIVRLDTAAAINDMNNFNAEIQKIINGEMAKDSAGAIDGMADFLESMVPFAESSNVARIVDELRGGEDTATTYGKSLLFLGQQRNQIRETIRRMPPQEQLAAAEGLAKIISNHPGILLQERNDFAAAENLKIFIEEGYYTDTDQILDNMFSILDAIGVGATVKSTSKAFKSLIQSLGRTSAVKSTVQPATVSQTVKNVNPTTGRQLHELAVMDTSEESAEALYGSTRVDAVVNDLGPEISVDGVVKNKVGNIDRRFNGENTPNAHIIDFAERDGSIYYINAEKQSILNKVTTDFKNAVGLHTRSEMSSIQHLDDGSVGIRMVYGPEEAGFSDPTELMNHAKFVFRDYGITDDQIQILKNVAGNYVPISAEQAVGKGDYLLSLNHKYRFNPADVVEWSNADVKRNMFDYILPGTTGRTGTLQRHILDAHSVLHPNITFGANVAVDRATGLEATLADLGREFSKGFAALPSDRRNLVEKIIKDGNEQGISFNNNKLKADGVTDEEINLLGKWKESWDTMYWLENADLAKSLRNRGFMSYEDKATNTRLFARPRAQRNFANPVKVYNAETNKIKTLKVEDINKIYEEGGTLAQLRRGHVVDDDVADFIVSSEKSSGAYLRAINDSDQVLNYRQGYYQVNYKDPQFIVRRERDKAGNIISEKAVSTAGNIADAELVAKRLSAIDGGEYFFRGDVKKVDSRSDDYWDLQTAVGRTAQRTRGQRLEGATTPITAAGHENIIDPVEALTKSIRSISRRVSMRDYLAATEKRFINQFGEMLPKDKFGQPRLPDRIDEIGSAAATNKKELADAKTTFEYINYMKNGYNNAIDDAYKASLNRLADVLGGAKLTKLENTARAASEGRPTQTAKGLAFKLYLAANPARQAIIQSHQAVRLTALFPDFVGKGKMTQQTLGLFAGMRDYKYVDNRTARLAGFRDAADANKAVEDFRRSGLFASVDANNLVRGDLKSLADINLGGKLKTAIGKPINVLQEIGFDVGEQTNIMTAWLAYRDKYVKLGKTLNQTEIDEISAQARNITYNMNSAGDMPYNQNALNTMFQFLQVPHKAILQDLTNRGLSRAERAKLLAFDTVMWGVPTGLVPGWFSQYLPDDPTARDAISRGLEQLILNKSISFMYGEPTNIDFGALAPSDMFGVAETVGQLWTTDLGSIVANSPSGQLFFGNNPRMTNFIKTAARYTNLVDDYEDPTELSNVAHSFATLFSGYSNAMKAKYALEYGQKMNSIYDISDYEVNTPEAIAQIFGFNSMDEAKKFAVKRELYDSTFVDSDVRAWYKQLKLHLGRKGITSEELEFSTKAFSEAWRVWGNDNTAARKELVKLIQRDVKNNDDVLFMSLMRQTGMGADLLNLERMVRDSGMDEKKIESLLGHIEYVKQLRSEDLQ